MLPVNYIEVEQQSPEWLEMRKGMVTASMVKHAVAKLATVPSIAKKCADGKHEACAARHCTCQCHGVRTFYQQCREDYMFDVVATRITGEMPDRYVSKAMQEGTNNEPLALAAYENLRDVMVEPIGFVFHPRIKWYGASPDGLLGSDIVIEAKCPTQATHMRYWMEFRDAQAKGLDYVPEEYLEQVKSQLSCTERPMCHFVSYHPKFPESRQLLVSEWRRDKGKIAEQEAEVEKFLVEAEEFTQDFMAERV